MPEGDVPGLCSRLALQVEAAVEKQPGLHVAGLTDGAPEMHQRLDEALAQHAPAVKSPVRVVDFWHLMEKLGAAALVLAGDRAPALREKWRLALLNQSSGQHIIDLRSLVLSDCWDTAMDLTLAPLRSQVRRAA